MTRTQLRRSKLGKELARLVGARKAVKLLQSLYTSSINTVFDEKCIGEAIIWIDTPQGWDYWDKLFYKQAFSSHMRDFR